MKLLLFFLLSCFVAQGKPLSSMGDEIQQELTTISEALERADQSVNYSSDWFLYQFVFRFVLKGSFDVPGLSKFQLSIGIEPFWSRSCPAGVNCGELAE